MNTDTVSETKTSYDTDLEKAADFFSKLRLLDPGRRAALRHGAGATIDQTRRVSWFYGVSDYTAGRDLAPIFLAATCFMLDKRSLKAVPPPGGNMGNSFRNLSIKASSKNIDSRFIILLDSTLDYDGGGELAYRLPQAVRLLCSKEIIIDWPVLLLDLQRWGHPRKIVQKRWAQSYYGGPASAISATPTETVSESEEEKKNAS